MDVTNNLFFIGRPCRFVEEHGRDLLPTGMNVSQFVNVSREICEERCGGDADPKCWVYRYNDQLGTCDLYSGENMPNCDEISSWSRERQSEWYTYRRVCLGKNSR